MGERVQASGLRLLGLPNLAAHWQASVPALYEAAIRRGEGVIAAAGPLVCRTVPHTGRSPNDKFIVREPGSAEHVWWGRVNRPLDRTHFDLLYRHVLEYLEDKEVYVQEACAGADPAYRLPLRVVTEYAWHSLFAKHLFIGQPGSAARAEDRARFTVIDVPGCQADPARHGTPSEVFIVINFAERLVLIGGTSYAGEIKKSVFTVMNYLLPLRGVLPMHCSANVGADGGVALFFGLSGTGKTTLSSDPERRLVGDDEHGWSDRGVFNFEGGCYAKMIRLSPEAEPQIWAATHRFGTVLENVVVDPVTRELDLNDDSLTENTRGAYPLSFVDHAVPSGVAGHPRHIVMLTADAFGVLPPLARLSPAGAMYHFLSGYTAKVAGTEKGVTEPKATFSTCFGAPFLVWPPTVYAKLLGERIATHRVAVWLVNTGWTGGAYGVGHRLPIAQTRAMIRAVLSGALDAVPVRRDPVFNLDVPVSCPDVPAPVLTPRATWGDPAAYDARAAELARMFTENFRTFRGAVEADVVAAGPRADE